MTLDELEQLEKSAYIDGPMIDITETGAIFNTAKGDAFNRIGQVSLNILPEVIALVRAVKNHDPIWQSLTIEERLQDLITKLGAQ